MADFGIFTTNNFTLSVDNSLVPGTFRKVTGLEMKYATVKHQEVVDGKLTVIQIPGGPEVGNITMERRLDQSAALSKWQQDTFKKGKVNGTISAVGPSGSVVASWNFEGGVAIGYKASDMDASQNTVATETITIAFDLLERSQ